MSSCSFLVANSERERGVRQSLLLPTLGLIQREGAMQPRGGDTGAPKVLYPQSLALEGSGLEGAGDLLSQLL